MQEKYTFLVQYVSNFQFFILIFENKYAFFIASLKFIRYFGKQKVRYPQGFENDVEISYTHKNTFLLFEIAFDFEFTSRAHAT